MRRLCLLRHGKSSWDDAGLRDFDRPLSGRGRRAAKAMADFITQAGLRPDVVLCSAARRTRETRELAAAALDGVPIAVEDGLYLAEAAKLAERLRKLDDAVHSALLIGHNPGLERLAAALTGGKGDERGIARMKEKFPTGALAVVDCDVARWRDLGEGACRLVSFTRPGDLEGD